MELPIAGKLPETVAVEVMLEAEEIEKLAVSPPEV